MVVDLTSVYRIDVTSSDNTVAMNAKICLTEEGKRDKSIQAYTSRYWNVYSTCKNCLDSAFNHLSSNFDRNFIDRIQVVGYSVYRVPDLSLIDLDSAH